MASPPGICGSLINNDMKNFNSMFKTNYSPTKLVEKVAIEFYNQGANLDRYRFMGPKLTH